MTERTAKQAKRQGGRCEFTSFLKRATAIAVMANFSLSAYSAQDGRRELDLAPASNINRLQLRYVTYGGYAINQTMFARWSSGFFALADLEHNSEYGDNDKRSPKYQRVEAIMGGPLAGPPIGWVGRIQKLSHIDTVKSLGLQFNITELPALRLLAKQYKASTFVQIFPVKNDHSRDVLHYYQVQLVGKIYVRGTNSWMRLRDGSHFARVFADFLYPVDKHFDTYLRYVWQNRQDVQYGVTGSTWALGVRYNFSF